MSAQTIASKARRSPPPQKLTLRRAELADAEAVAALPRGDDPHPRGAAQLRAEIIATPEPWLFLWDDEPAALFGLIPEDRAAGAAVCWLATTSVARRGGVAFARESRRVWPALRDGWRRVDGFSPALSRSAELWLRSLGFEVTRSADGARFRWLSEPGQQQEGAA